MATDMHANSHALTCTFARAEPRSGTKACNVLKRPPRPSRMTARRGFSNSSARCAPKEREARKGKAVRRTREQHNKAVWGNGHGQTADGNRASSHMREGGRARRPGLELTAARQLGCEQPGLGLNIHGRRKETYGCHAASGRHDSWRQDSRKLLGRCRSSAQAMHERGTDAPVDHCCAMRSSALPNAALHVQLIRRRPSNLAYNHVRLMPMTPRYSARDDPIPALL